MTATRVVAAFVLRYSSMSKERLDLSNFLWILYVMDDVMSILFVCTGFFSLAIICEFTAETFVRTS